MCVFVVRSRVTTEGGSEVEAAIEKAFATIAEVQPLEKEGEPSAGDLGLPAVPGSAQGPLGRGPGAGTLKVVGSGLSVSASNDREARAAWRRVDRIHSPQRLQRHSLPFCSVTRSIRNREARVTEPHVACFVKWYPTTKGDKA